MLVKKKKITYNLSMNQFSFDLCLFKKHFTVSFRTSSDVIFCCKIYSQQFLLLPTVKLCYLLKVLFTNPSARAGYDTRSIFKRSLTGLNSEFSFS